MDRSNSFFATRLGKATGALGAIYGPLPRSYRDRAARLIFLRVFSDFVCGILLIIGLGARWAALYCLANILVAWAFVHQFSFFGKGPASDHGELIVLYLGALLTLLIAGPGAASIDRALSGKP